VPVLQVSTARSRAEYDLVRGAVFAGDRPPGLLAHAASELPDGSVQIVDVFESRETLERFGRERISPAFVTFGLPGIAERGGPPPSYQTIDWIRP
jgi:hypothetical protein